MEQQLDEFEKYPIQEQDLRILKTLVSDTRLALDFANTYSSNLFFGDARDVAGAMIEYIKAYKTVPTQRVLIDAHKQHHALVGKIKDVFSQFDDIEINSMEYGYDVEKLRQRYVQTKIADLRDVFRYGDVKDDTTTIKNVERTLKDVQQISQPAKKSYTQRTLRDYLPEFKNDYVARLHDPTLGQGVLTGYSYFDYVTNGVRPAELVIIGAETSAGKSMLLNNMAIQMWMQKNTLATEYAHYTPGYNVLYFSLEMPFEGCFRRTMARLADVPSYGLRDSKLTKAEADSVSMAGRFISKYPAEFEIVDIPRGVTVEQIEERYLEAKTKFEPHVVVVDYLGLLEDRDVTGDDWLKLGYIAGKLHEFARVHNVRVLTAVQLNRAQLKKDQDPSELIGVHRFGRSSLIAHHANICVQIESRPDEYLRGDLIYHIIKNRDGERGAHTVLKKFAHCAIFDTPYAPPDRDEFGALVSGFDDSLDISDQVAKILGI